MQKVVKIIRHVDCEGPGYLLTVLERNNIFYEIIKIDENQNLPTNLDDTFALVSMGGGMSVNDNLPWIEQEMALIRLAEDKGIPVLGHCLGAQLMAKAFGAEVVSNPVKEIGWFNVEIAANAGDSNKWFDDISFPLNVFHWHGETFKLPTGAINVLRSESCTNQCFVRGKMIGFQCHIEMTAELIKEWVARFIGQVNINNPTEQSPEIMLQNLDENVKQLNVAADIFYQRWIDKLIIRS